MARITRTIRRQRSRSTATGERLGEVAERVRESFRSIEQEFGVSLGDWKVSVTNHAPDEIEADGPVTREWAARLATQARGAAESRIISLHADEFFKLYAEERVARGLPAEPRSGRRNLGTVHWRFSRTA